VGDQHGGGTDTPQQVMDLLAQLDAQLGVEGRERFVEQDQLGLGGERPGQRHPLLLTTGQLVWLAVAQPGQADEVEQLVDPIATGRAGRAGQPEGDVAGDAEVREQRTFLGDDADAPGVGPHGGGRRRVERTTGQGDHAIAGVLKPGDAAQQRGLARPGRAQHGGEAAGLDLEAGPVEGDGGVAPTRREGLGQVADAQHGSVIVSTSSSTDHVIAPASARIGSTRTGAPRAESARVGSALRSALRTSRATGTRAEQHEHGGVGRRRGEVERLAVGRRPQLGRQGLAVERDQHQRRRQFLTGVEADEDRPGDEPG
jgi:hypothetical protein